jgi:hypothetical protein
MSKQTNPFQKLIHYIHSNVEPTDAKVTESASALEKNIEEPVAREIDVLIEKEINDKIARIAVECRDRACKDDIEWVDSLVGKYKHLDIHKVIAVSNSGFSRSAKLKAEANGIELRTLEEALKINFGDEFHKLAAVYVSHIVKLKTVTLSFTPPAKFKPLPTTIFYHNGQPAGTLDDLTKSCYEEVTKKKLIPYYKQNLLGIFKTRADLDRQMLIEHTIPITEFYIESASEKFFITSVTFTLIGVPTIKDMPAKHRTYKGALITESIFDEKEMDKIHTTWIVQFAKRSEGKIFMKSKLRKTKKKNV